MGFLTQLMSKKVRINREMTSRMTVRAKLSRRAVVKIKAWTGVSSTEQTNTKKRLN